VPRDILETVSVKRVDEAQAILADRYCAHVLAPVGRGEGLDFDFRSRHYGRVRCSLLKYGRDVEIDPGAFESFYMIELPLSGGVQVNFGGATVESRTDQAILLSPGRRLRSRWSADTREAMLMVDRDLVRERIEALARRSVAEVPVFAPQVRLSSAVGRVVRQTFSTAFRPLAGSPHEAEAEVTDATTNLVDTLLRETSVFPDGALVPERLQATPRHVKAAMSVLRRRFAEPLVMDEVAQEVGISPRGLFAGFRTYYQCSPYAMLTRIRIDAARRMIANGEAGVGEAARRVGISHAGRFSATYRALTGRHPSEDLPG
jgi:AraC-like DNA-binding protein